jgi:small subunit ribosomal protein S17
MASRMLSGKVVGMKQDKTIIVEVARVKTHPLYFKKYKMTKRFPTHFDGDGVSVGDMVLIQQTRPISKTKRFSYVRKLRAEEVAQEVST